MDARQLGGRLWESDDKNASGGVVGRRESIDELECSELLQNNDYARYLRIKVFLSESGYIEVHPIAKTWT